MDDSTGLRGAITLSTPHSRCESRMSRKQLKLLFTRRSYKQRGPRFDGALFYFRVFSEAQARCEENPLRTPATQITVVGDGCEKRGDAWPDAYETCGRACAATHGVPDVSGLREPGLRSKSLARPVAWWLKKQRQERVQRVSASRNISLESVPS